MKKYRQNQLLDVMRGTLGEFQKTGAEVSLEYKGDCIIAKVRTEICPICEQIHSGPCPRKSSPFE